MLPAVVSVCAVVTAIAVTGGSRTTPGLEFVQAGHWIYDSVLGTAFHVDGGSKNVDAEVAVPGAGAGATVVQTERNGYVLSRDKIVEFGKSDLTVADSKRSPASEKPVGLEAAGAAYAVYPNAGRIVRFGERPVSESMGGRLDAPVVTNAGTLWVHRADGGQLCRLPLGATRSTCTGSTPKGHTGALTLIGDRPAWVDTVANTVSTVTDDGLGRALPLGVDLPESSVVATNDLRGRVAVVDPGRSVLHLIDAGSALAGKVVEPPISTDLGSGRYDQIASGRTALALIERNTDTVVTVDHNGEIRHRVRIPAPTKKSEKPSEPSLFRGGDSHLYVDSASGEHVMVVEDGGDVTPVRVGRDPKERASTRPTPRTTPSSPATKVRQTTKSKGPSRGGSKGTREPRKRPEPPVKASRPGAPTNVDGRAGNARITVTWGAASGNGSPITAYVLSWSGGSKRVSGNAREATVTGLRNGSSYAITVRAATRAGTGPGVATGRLTPGGAADAPPNFRVERISDEEHMFYWDPPNLNGNRLVTYRLDRDYAENTKDTTRTSQIWGGLKDGTQYHFTVVAVTEAPGGGILIGKVAELDFSPGSGTFSTRPE